MKINRFIALLFFSIITTVISCATKNSSPMKNIELIQKFAVADSLSLAGNKNDLSAYTKKELVPLFDYFNSSRKSTVLNYLVESKDTNNLQLANKILLSNLQNINKCDLVSIDLINLYNSKITCTKTEKLLNEVNWDDVYEKDQKYRNLLPELEDGSKELDSISNLMNQQDLLNKNIISSYIESNDINKIAESDCDCKALKTMFFVALHSENDSVFRNDIIDKFSTIKSNNISSKYLAYLIDRKLIREGKEQIYGTQMEFDPNTLKLKPYPISDLQRIDFLRFETNLPSLKQYVDFMNKRKDK